MTSFVPPKDRKRRGGGDDDEETAAADDDEADLSKVNILSERLIQQLCKLCFRKNSS